VSDSRLSYIVRTCTRHDQILLIRIAVPCHKLGQLCAERSANQGFHNSSFDPQTLVVLETAFDEAWLTLKSIGNTTVKPDELARCVLRLAMEGERDPVQLHDDALKGLIPASSWREAG